MVELLLVALCCHRPWLGSSSTKGDVSALWPLAERLAHPGVKRLPAEWRDRLGRGAEPLRACVSGVQQWEAARFA